MEELHGGLRREEDVEKQHGGLLKRAKRGVVLEAGGWLVGARARGSPRRRQTKPLRGSSIVVVAEAGWPVSCGAWFGGCESIAACGFDHVSSLPPLHLA